MSRSLVRRAAALVSLALTFALALAGCGGDDGTAAPAAGGTGPAANRAPIPAIAAAGSVQAGKAVALDASASSDADGDTLTYSWDFGDGGHGGGARLAHIFTAAGSHTVTLAVSDGQGHVATTTQTIDVTAGPVAGATIPVTGFIGDRAGPLSGVTAQWLGGAANATSDANGKVVLQLPTGVPVVLRLSKAGYADQTVPLQLIAGAPDANFKAGMLQRAAAQDFDPVAGATIVGTDGATVAFGPKSLVDSAGRPVSGTAQISITPVDIRGTGAALFPGAFAGIDANGAAQPIASHGTVEFVPMQGAQKLQLAPGATATVELPIYAAQNLDGTAVAVGQVIPLWSLDEGSGQWVQEGTGTVVASATTPSGLALRATVGHFTWWNGDTFIFPPEPYEPQPQCWYSPGPEFQPIPEPCSLGPEPPNPFDPFGGLAVRGDRKKAQGAATNGFNVPPSYSARIEIPVGGGIPVPLPANLDWSLYACSSGGLHCGRVVAHGGPAVSDVVIITLQSLAPAGTCNTPTALTLPAATDAGVTDVTKPVCFTFTANGGDVLSLGVTPNNGSSLTGTFQVTDPTGTSLGGGNFGPTVTTPAPRRLATATGTYTLMVTPAATSPAGGLHLVLSGAPATPVPVPSAALTLPLPSDLDARFDIAAGQVLALSVRAHGLRANLTSLADGQTRSLLTSGDDTLYGAFTYRSQTAAMSGFSIQRLQLNQGQTPEAFVTLKPALPLVIGDVATGSIAAGMEVMSYVFDANAGDIVFATTVSDAVGNGGVPHVRLFDDQTRDYNPSQYGYPIWWQAGPYVVATTGTLRVDAFTSQLLAAPNYSLRVVKVAPPTAIVPTGAVTTVSGSIAAIGDQRYYTLPLNAGDVVSFSISSPGALGMLFDVLAPDATKPFYARTLINDLHLQTADPSGAVLNQHDAYTLMYLAPQTGDYTVHVGASTQYTALALGNYSFTIQHPVAVALPLGNTVAGSLPAPFGVQRFSLDVAAAGDYRVCVRSPTWVQAELRDAAGQSLVVTTNRDGGSGGNFRNPEFVQTLAVGSYTFDVFSRTSATTSFDVVWRPAGDPHPACQ
jgi:PKD repeat protein